MENKRKQKKEKPSHFQKSPSSTASQKREWNFVSASYFFILLSFAITLFSFLVIFSKSFNYGIDFAGGTEVQVQFSELVKIEELRKFMQDLKEKKLFKQNAMVQSFGEKNEFLIRIEGFQEKSMDKARMDKTQIDKSQMNKTQMNDPLQEESEDQFPEKEKGQAQAENEADTQEQGSTNFINQKTQAMIQSFSEGIKERFKSKKPVLRRVDSVGPQVGSELKRNSLMAIFYSLLIILIYISLRFDYKYAPGAVFCLFHDTLLTLGIFSLFQLEVSLQTLTAILTIIGYSLNDTIVTFDRIRENAHSERDLDFSKIVNRSINEVLSRTLLTSFTTLLALGSMYLISGGVIQSFAFALGMGVIIGTYSSIYVAAPLVILVDRLEQRKKA